MSEEFLNWFERFYESKPYFTKEEKKSLSFTHGLHGAIHAVQMT